MTDSKDHDRNGSDDPLKTLGVTDIAQVGNQLWMVRLPSKLTNDWKDLSPGSIMGELVFKKGGKDKGGKIVKPSLSVECDESTITQKDTPLHYSLEALTKKVPNLYSFSRTEEGSVQLHGTVSRSANLQASRDDPRYRQLSKNRLLKSSVNNTRFVKQAEATELSVRKSMHANQGFGSAVQAYGMRLKQDATSTLSEQDSSRKRKYQDIPTRSVIFELFSLQPYWTVKQLKEQSGKPEKELRAVLTEIGDYHRSGEFKNMWSLKEEYQQASSAGGDGMQQVS